MQYLPQYPRAEASSYGEENISVTLHNQDLWTQFYNITNEMIVTKVGRRMFPIIAVDIRGLDPDKMYTIELAFDQIDEHRWRYVTSEWQAGLKPDPPVHRPPYQHPDSPNYGRRWMKDPVQFSKVKLTNKAERSGAPHILLNSLHKYRPRISIIDVMTKTKIYEMSFILTEFIAVTAYQSEEVKALKIKHNPFAKAFLDGGNMKQELLDVSGMQRPMFYSHESSTGGPDRLKLSSYRSSPYCYSPRERKPSPKEEIPSPPSSTKPADFNAFYHGAMAAYNPPMFDVNAYYNNYYYPNADAYYYPYGQSQAAAPQYPFMSSLNYPSNDDTSTPSTSPYLHFQQPFLNIPNVSHYSNTSPPTQLTNDFESL